MELKYLTLQPTLIQSMSFNRTFMELKLAYVNSNFTWIGRVLIVPLWN